jgi:hypothetical protein
VRGIEMTPWADPQPKRATLEREHMVDGPNPVVTLSTSQERDIQKMKVEHLFQVVVAEIAFHEIFVNALNAFIVKRMNVSAEEVETFVENYQTDKRQAYVESVHKRMQQRINALGASS